LKEPRGQSIAPRILLADDNPEIRQRVAELLRADFHVVGSAEDGQQAIESALKLNPDVVVLDISMPVLNGIQAASRLRDLGCSAKVIFLTVHADHDYVETAFSVGALGYVLKSRLTTDLITAIEQALQERKFISPFPVQRG
jgi:DNA-binding NarL/FixJ family response regulator